jgi:hypothetical protein
MYVPRNPVREGFWAMEGQDRRDSAVRDGGPVVKSWSDTATAIARRYRRLSAEFIAAGIRDVVDVSDRHFRRVLD